MTDLDAVATFGTPITCRLKLRHADFIMQNHRVHEVSVMPGATFLDIVLRLVRAHGVDQSRVELRNILFAEAIATSEEYDREIVVDVRPPDGRTRGVVARSRLTRSGAAASEWRENMRADLVLIDDPEPSPVDVASLIRAASARRDMADLYVQARAEHIRHGDPMRCFGTLYSSGGALLAELDLGEQAARHEDRFHLHPAKLDASTLVAFGRTGLLDEPFIPVYIERFRSPRPAHGRCYVHVPEPEVVADSGDVMTSSYTIYDEHGTYVAGVDRLTCKRIRHRGLVTRLLSPDGNTGTAVAGVAGESSPGSRPVRRDAQEPVSAAGFAGVLREMVARHLGVSPAAVDPSQGFYELGLDSVAMLTMSRELEEAVGGTLYPTLLFEHGNLERLASHLTAQYGEPSLPASSSAAGEAALPVAGSATEPTVSCYRPVWRAEPPSPAAPAGRPGGDLVVFGAAPAHLDALRTALPGHRIVTVEPGPTFTVTAGGYRLDDRRPDQLGLLFADLARHAAEPPVLLRLGLTAPPPGDPVSPYHQAWAVAAAIVGAKPRAAVTVFTVHEDGVPAHAAVPALARTIGAETPQARLRSIVVEPDLAAAALAQIVRAEVVEHAGDVEHEVSYRGGVRHRRAYERLELADGTAIRHGGSYLVTGGGGALGRLLADHLARQFSARLLLVGRSAQPPAELDAWRGAGARVEYLSADLGRRQDALDVVEAARAAHGQLHGVFHCAGVVEDAVSFLTAPERAERIFAGKVAGLLHLDTALAGEELDFLALFSSIAAVVPNPGQGAYAYANSFLDHVAAWRNGRPDRPGRTVSFNWPYWSGGGMRVAAPELDRDQHATGRLPLPDEAGLRTLERGLASGADRIVVAYGDRDRLDHLLGVTGQPEPAVRVEPLVRAAAAEPQDRDVAIIGLAGRYPQAPDLARFWENLRLGRDCVTEVPAERWDHEAVFAPEKGRPGRTYSRWGGFLDGVGDFDADFFGISRRDAERMDPQERLFLTTSWQALEDAGHPAAGLTDRAVGVFAGVMWSHYQLLRDEHGVAPTALHASVPNRVSYCLDLTGPSIAVDTACSSSLVAVHLAVESLLRGECSMALAGGVNVSVHEQKYIQLAHGQFLSTDGRCRSFGRDGSGYVPGEGVGVVVLKPLARARADGDHVYGVIRGSGLNHSGRTSGFTVPSPAGQAELIRSALQRSGVDPRTIGYVEAHGTGTSLGDPIEWDGLRQAFAAAAGESGPRAVGSVKSNIGHLESAAGIAGITKVLLQLRHRWLAPTLHAAELNPHLDLSSDLLAVQRDGAPWPAPGPGLPRRAGVSAFGAGGANAHVIIEEFVPTPPEHEAGSVQPMPILLSARDDAGLREYAAALAAALEAARDDPPSLAQIAYTLQTGRSQLPVRWAATVATTDELPAVLRTGPGRQPSPIPRPDYSGPAELADRFGDRPPRRISLPCAPLREQRYWLGEWAGRGAAGEPARPPAQDDGGGQVMAPEQLSHDEPLSLRVLESGIAVLVMNADGGNMFSDQLLQGLELAFSRVESDDDITAVVLTGSGPAFSMGGTPEALAQLAGKQGSFADVPFLYEGLLRCRVPVIAAVQGHASGGGLTFGLYADLVVMSRQAVYSANFLKYGFTPGIGATYILGHRFGPTLSREMLLTGRGYPGTELERRGAQVSFADGPQVLDAALELARSVAHLPPEPVRALKAELAGRVLGELPGFIESEVRLHDEVLGPDSVELVRNRFGVGPAAAPAPVETSAPAAADVTVPASAQPADQTAAVHEQQHERPGVVAAIEEALCDYLFVERHELDPARSFSEMGLDSIGAVELVGRLNADYGLDLDSVAVYDHATISALADLVLADLARVRQLRDSAVHAVSGNGRVAAASEQATPVVTLRSLPRSPAARRPVTSARPGPPPTVAAVPPPAAVRTGGPRREPASDTTEDQSDDEPEADAVAVIGMSGRFPGAEDLAQFWDNLAAGRVADTDPGARWDPAGYVDPDPAAPGRSYSARAALLSRVDEFDAGFFHLSPLEAEAVDPQQRLFLQEAWRCLEDAGYAGEAGTRRRWGVFVGCGPGDYTTLLAQHGQADSGHAFLGGSSSILAARIAYVLDLAGPTVAIDTACSSSLVAIHLACESVRRGEADLALAGGVALMLTPQLQVRCAKVGMLSPTGTCRPFDAAADGIVLGEGVGVVALKRLADALRDGDHIHGVIRASGVNGDGKTNGITAPSATAQAELLTRVHRQAGVAPERIDWVETHGTGTALGDPIEAKALKLAFGPGEPGRSGLGSVKGNIGHTTMAAGVASLIKVLLALRHRQLPPTPGYVELNDKIDLDGSPFSVMDELADWRPGPGGSRLAGVSSFGFSGTNCHLVVEQAPERVPPPSTGAEVLVPLSARTVDELDLVGDRLAEALTDTTRVEDVAFTLGTGRRHLPVRAALVASSTAGLRRQLRDRPWRAPEADPPPGTAPAVARARAAWLAGEDVDWPALHADTEARRVPLPTYPFAPERHWVQPGGSAGTPARPGVVADPVVATDRAADLLPVDALVADHRVGGTPILPATGGLALALAAAGDRPVTLRSLAWLRPLPVTTPVQVRVAFAEAPEGQAFRLLRSGEDAPYAKGVLVRGTGPRPEPVDVIAATTRCSGERSAEEVYAAFRAAGIDYGPSFRLLTRLFSGPGEALAALSPPTGSAARGWDATVLDAALQATTALVDGAGGALLPFALDRLEVFGPAADVAWSHARQDASGELSVCLLDQAGQVLARAAGLHLRPAPRVAANADADADPLAGMTFVPEWRPAPSRAAAAQPAGRVAIAYADEATATAAALASRFGAGAVVIPLSEADALQPPYDTVVVVAGRHAEPGERGTRDLLRLVQALLRGQRSHSLRLTVVAPGASGAPGAPVDPHAAGLFGLAGAVAAECPGWTVRCLDPGPLDGAALDRELADRLAHEVTSPGERLVAWRDGRRLVRELTPVRLTAAARPRLRTGGTYLIVGGGGGIGQELSRHLARHYQATLIWVGRRPLDARLAEAMTRVEALGGRVRYLAADVAEPAALESGLDRLRAEVGPLSGVFHSALVLRDRAVAQLSDQDLADVLRPKTDGLLSLYHAVERDPLDFFLLFSSAAALMDSAGQANYAAASTYEDAAAGYLRGVAPFPVQVVDWGFWGSVGVVADDRHRAALQRLGVGSIEPAEGLEAVERILAAGLDHVLVIEADARGLAPLGIEADARPEGAYAALDRFCRDLLAWSWREPPAAHEVVDDLRPLYDAVLDILDRAGEPGPHPPDADAFLRRHPDLAAHVTLLRTCLDSLTDVLAGRLPATQVLFPGGRFDLVEGVYHGQAETEDCLRLLADEVAAAVVTAGRRPVRIVEVGAGTGSGSRPVIEACSRLDVPVEYVYTDLSAAFLSHGEQEFGRYGFVSVGRLDIERDPRDQGFAAGEADIVVATNVLHATGRIGQALEHVRLLLRPGGHLVLNEVTKAYDFLTLTFGLTPGWWRYRDAERRLPNAPLLDPGQWRVALAGAGFSDVRVRGHRDRPEEELDQCILVARLAAAPSAPPSGHEADPAAARGYVRSIFAEVLKLAPERIADDLTFEHIGVDSLVSQTIIDRLERDLGGLPSTLLFEHLTVSALAEHLLTDRPEALAAVLPGSGEQAGPAEPAAAGPPVAVEPPPDRVTVPGGTSPGPGTTTAGDIAVIGVAGRYPGSPDLDAFWANLAAGRNCVTEIPAQRWDWRRHFDADPNAAQRSYSRWGGFIDGVDLFDPAHYGILPLDAADIDPQERLFLQTAGELLERAGYLGEHTRVRETGVFAGLMYGTYGQLAASAWNGGRLAGAHSAYWSVANRVSYVFDLQGPSYAVDSACSSSLTAVHLACESLRRGECRTAIAGGVNLILHPSHFVALCALNMLAADGATKVLDARADGFTPGEGVGAVLLKPLADAVADNDDIWAVIKGSSVNAGGKVAGYTVPNPAAQAAVVGQALRRAGVDPRTVSYVEAHGTGTELGDPVEVAALTRAFGAAHPGRCVIGSVKANIGHLEGAAGIAGLTKTLLQLRQRVLAPVANLDQVNPKIDLDASPFHPLRESAPWRRPRLDLGDGEREYPLRAGVSSFGAGGANAHVVLEEYRPPPAAATPDDGPLAFLLSARTEDLLRSYATAVADYVDRAEQSVTLTALACASQVGRPEQRVRLAAVVGDRDELARLLRRYAGGVEESGLAVGTVGRSAQPDPPADGTGVEQLCRAWVDGARVDWRSRWPDPLPRRAPFPPAPTDPQRHWLDPDPLARFRGPQSTTVEVTVPIGAAGEHRVGQAHWLPGMAFLEPVRATAGRPLPLQVGSLTWRRPLILTDRAPMVQITLMTGDDGTRFTVSQPGGRVAYVEGTLRGSGPEPAPLDLAAWRDRCSQRLDVAQFYAGLRRAGLVHGPALQVVRELSVGDDAAFALLSTDAAVEEQLPPALLDGALQVVAALIPGEDGYVPAGFEAMTVYRGFPADCLVAAARSGSPDEHRFDLDLAGTDGRLVATIRGLAVAPVDTPPDTACRYQRRVWTPQPLTGAARDLRTVLVVGDGQRHGQAWLDRWAGAGVRAVVVGPESAPTAEIPALLPGDRESARALIDALARQDLLPEAIVLFDEGTDGGLDQAVSAGFGTLLWLATAVLERGRRVPLRLVAGYREHGEWAAWAALNGALRTLELEHGACSGSVVALSPSVTDPVPPLVDEVLRGGSGHIRIDGTGRAVRVLAEVDVPSTPEPAALTPGGTYLITGGTGRLGRHVGRFLAGQGLTVVLAGRTPPDPRQQAEIAAIGTFHQADVSSAADVRRLVDDIRRRHGALHGIIHTAGVHEDRRAVQKTPDEVARVIAAKVHGTLHLHEATRDDPLDLFVLFSSVVGESGNAGQVDYAYANSFLDHFARQRQQWQQAGRCSGRTVSIAWPLWRDGGMTLDAATERLLIQRHGMVPMRTSVGLRAFTEVLATPYSDVLVMERPAIAPAAAEPVTGANHSGPGGTDQPGVADPDGGPALTVDEVRETLRALAAGFLLVDPAEVDVHVELMELGFDSISLTALINQVNERYRLDLLPTVLFEHPTLADVAEYLVGDHDLRGEPDQPPESGAAPEPPAATTEAVAIVGMAGILPGSPDLAAFWEHLAAGRDLVGPVPPDRTDLLADPETAGCRGGFIDDVAAFDTELFGIAPREAALMDPQQRLFLQAAWRAIEDAGYRPADLRQGRTALFAGVSTSDYDDLMTRHGVGDEAHRATGASHAVLANRVSYLFDLRGPSEAVDTACSSALVALHRAVRALRSGECDLALAGGVSLALSPGLFASFTRSGMLSPDGRCKTFDAAADGYVRGEGAGVVLLKPLARALADGDHIRAVVRGSAVNHGGRATSLTAPNPAAQAAVLVAAYRDAGVDPSTVGYLEAHGTGTKLGDPVEIEGIKEAFATLRADAGEPSPSRLVVGSVKTNVGHLEAAAGVAGLLKTVLAMEHGVIPASLHLREPNPYLRLDGTGLTLATQAQPWEPAHDGGAPVLRAGVSAFGFGGTNAHVVLEHRPRPDSDPRGAGAPGEPVLLVLSAPRRDALTAYARRLADVVEDGPHLPLSSVSYTLQVGRTEFEHRIAVVATDRAEAVRALRQATIGTVDAAADPRLAELAQRWVAHEKVDWAQLWPQPPRRVPLPGFPFATTRHWFPLTGNGAEPMARNGSGPMARRGEDPVTRNGGDPAGPVGGGRIRLRPARAALVVARSGPPVGSRSERLDAPAVPAAVPAPVPPASTADSVADVVVRELAEVVGVPAEEIDPSQPFDELGLDSIFRMDLAAALNATYGLGLKAADLYEHGTAAALAAHVDLSLGNLEATMEPARSAEPVRGDRGGDPVRSLRELMESVLGRALDPQETFQANGCTSFDMLRVVSALEASLGSLRKTLLFDQPTLTELADHLVTRFGADAVAAVRPAAPLAPDGDIEPVPAVSELATGPGDAPLVVPRSLLARSPALRELVAGLDERFSMETGLAGRDIAPLLFIGSRRQSYVNFSRRGDVVFAWSYVGPGNGFAELIAEWVEYGHRQQVRPTFLSLDRLERAGDHELTATPFGAVQRLPDLAAFTTAGGRMSRLRYMVQRFERDATCQTAEYVSGSDPAQDQRITELIDRWAEGKQMVNPYVATVREELRTGRLDARHRVFLTVRDDTLCNAIVITRMPVENGYLLDVEFYPREAPLGGLEYAIVKILDQLRAEGCATFSFGASFGVKLADSPNADPAAEEALEQLREAGIFGTGNYQFKNKFRPENLPLYLCQSATAGPTDVADIILMIAHPSIAPAGRGELGAGRGDGAPGPAEPAEPAEPAQPAAVGEADPPAPADARSSRRRHLAEHGYNPVLLPPELPEYDLLTDSWAELAMPAVAARTRDLADRLAGSAGHEEEIRPPWLPFPLVLTAGSGRAAEALLCRSWPGPRGTVAHNALFPTLLFNLADNGFAPVEIPAADGGWAGDIDLAALAGLLSAGAVSFVCLEACGNARGGRPLSFETLRAVKELAALYGVPLVLDATRVVENAYLVAGAESGNGERDVWTVVADLLGQADAVTMSLSKDFGIDVGGLVAARGPELVAGLEEQATRRGRDLSLAQRRLVAGALGDQDGVARLVRQRMAAVAKLAESLAPTGAVLGDPGGHCVVLDLGRVSRLAGRTHPVAAGVAWIYAETGVRAGPHLGHIEGGTGDLVRLAVPLGLTVAQAAEVGRRIASLLTGPGTPPDLVTGARPGSPAQAAQASYVLAEHVPDDVREVLAAGYDPRDQNLDVVRELVPDVSRRIVPVPGGDAEVFLHGEGPTVLLMHPFNLGAGMYAEQLRALADAYRVVVVHHPGVGRTTAAGDLSLDGIADLHRAALEQLGLWGRVHVVGASFGGILAQSFALRFPDATASLSVICGSYKYANRSGEVNRLDRVVADDFDHILAQVAAPELAERRAGLIDRLLRSESMDPQVGLSYLDLFASQPDLLGRLSDIAVPTLIVQGRHDTVVPMKTAHLLHGAIPDARYVEIAGAGHFPCVTHPGEVSAALLGFLSGLAVEVSG